MDSSRDERYRGSAAEAVLVLSADACWALRTPEIQHEPLTRGSTLTKVDRDRRRED